MIITDVITEITDANFDDFVKNEGISVVDFQAFWCSPCKALGPIVDQLAVEFTVEKANVKVGKMNVDNSRDKSVDLGITSIPTILIYKDGVLAERHVGMIQKPKLRELIEKHM